MRKALIIFALAFILILPAIARADSQKILNPENGHYYQRIDKSMTWHEVKSYCEKLGGHLATITSESEDNFVYEKLCRNSPYECWLGGRDDNNQKEWEWITGENWSYENWNTGEPNNYCGKEFYLHYLNHFDNPGKWNDESDDGKCGSGYGHQFVPICEWDSSNQCSQSDLDQKYNEGYNAGYEAGKKFWKQNPSACGIKVSSSTDCSLEYQNGYNKGYEDGKNSCGGTSTNPFIPGSMSECYSTYNVFTNTLKIPCFSMENKMYDIEMTLESTKPIRFILKGVKEKGK